MSRILQSCPIRPVCLAVTIRVALLAARGVEAETIVVPPELKDVEANAHFAESTLSRPGARLQELHLASEFAQMSPSPGMIVQMAYRPDKNVTRPRTHVWHDFELRLSTTDRKPGRLSSRFDDNLGADTTIVYSGDLTLSTQGTGQRSGPRPFDYVIEFQQPFIYDPSAGNLLIDWRVRSIDGGPFIDGKRYYDGLNRSLFALSRSATSALVLFDTNNPLEFSVVPLSSPGDFDGDGLLTVTDIDMLTTEVLAETHTARYDLNDDALVNGHDRRVWIEDMKGTYHGDANLDLEFNSSDLVQVFASGKYEVAEHASWAEGDWDSNGFFDSSDMVTAFSGGGYEQGKKTAAAAVPEPTSILMLLAGAGLVSIVIRRRLLGS